MVIFTREYRKLWKNKSEEMINSLCGMSKRLNNDIRFKGDLYFKILLAVGAVLAILIWWLYGSFCVI